VRSTDRTQDNILFGAAFDEQRYKKVIHQCGLRRDLTLFDAGDLTEVGEKGLTLRFVPVYIASNHELTYSATVVVRRFESNSDRPDTVTHAFIAGSHCIGTRRLL
jgi:hypothetical protein